MIRILFLSANPENTTRLEVEKEISQIDKKIRSSEYRDQFYLQQWHAVSLSELSEYLLRYRPINIVHFSGHGSNEGKLIFENSDGHAEEASPNAISELFDIINDGSDKPNEERIRLVILNACYSEKQAKAISKYVDCVIGISGEIEDTAAISFAGIFYYALGYGENLSNAFRLGKNQLGLGSSAGERLFKLITRRDVDPSAIYLARKPEQIPTPQRVDNPEDQRPMPPWYYYVPPGARAYVKPWV